MTQTLTYTSGLDIPLRKSQRFSLDLVGASDDGVEDILSAVNALLKESREQDQRISNELESESASLKQLDLRIEDVREAREKSLKNLQEQVNNLDKRWEDLKGKTNHLLNVESMQRPLE